MLHFALYSWMVCIKPKWLSGCIRICSKVWYFFLNNLCIKHNAQVNNRGFWLVFVAASEMQPGPVCGSWSSWEVWSGAMIFKSWGVMVLKSIQHVPCCVCCLINQSEVFRTICLCRYGTLCQFISALYAAGLGQSFTGTRLALFGAILEATNAFSRSFKAWVHVLQRADKLSNVSSTGSIVIVVEPKLFHKNLQHIMLTCQLIPECRRAAAQC